MNTEQRTRVATINRRLVELAEETNRLQRELWSLIPADTPPSELAQVMGIERKSWAEDAGWHHTK